MRTTAPVRASHPVIRLMLAAGCFLLLFIGLAQPAHADENWDPVVNSVVTHLEQIPAQHAAGDATAVETSIRRAYYENYQVSGLEDQIKHRLGRERSDAFLQELLAVRQLARDGAPQADMTAAVQAAIDLLHADVAELATTAAINDQWTRVANSITEQVNTAISEYAAGNVDPAYEAATAAYLAHYEGDGLEKATIAYIGQGRVSEIEGHFRELRTGIRNGEPLADIQAVGEQLISKVQQDAAQLDQLTSPDSELGWRGFIAAFLVILREGAEALLVVAGVVTYVLRAGRRDQLKWVWGAVFAALVVSAGLAVLLNSLTSSAAAGFGQELVEGLTGVFAVVMLIYVSGWILGKAHQDDWLSHRLQGTETGGRGGTLTLASVVFFAVVREGAETILFFAPITVAAHTPRDYALIWSGVAAAAVILAILFLLVWRFGVRLPMRQFFQWISVLLAILAVTIAGGAAKEFQDATLLSATPLPGIPEIAILGLYPTVETILSQVIVAAIVVAFNLWNVRRAKQYVSAQQKIAAQQAVAPGADANAASSEDARNASTSPSPEAAASSPEEATAPIGGEPKGNHK